MTDLGPDQPPRVRHSHVKVDGRSIDNALADGSFTDVPLTNGFSATNPFDPRGPNGEVLSTFGFELDSTDNTLGISGPEASIMVARQLCVWGVGY